MRVFVAGASGVIGRPLVALLRRAGHEVVCMTRSDAPAADLEAKGTTAVVCDCFDLPRLARLMKEARPDAVINQLTSIPQRINPRKIKQEFAETNRLRRDGTANLVGAAVEAGARTFIAQSIAFAYAPGTPGLRTVLRYGFFYGAGTVYASSGSFCEAVRKRTVPIIGRGDGVFSFVHIDDAAAATVLTLGHTRAGIYNIVDDDPTPVREWLPEFAKIVGAKRPMTVPRIVGRLGAGPYGSYLMTEMPGASNQKARLELNWTPRYTSWRDGMRADNRG